MAGGFLSPTQHSEEQRPWDQQVAISFLLGLDWSIPTDWQPVPRRASRMAAARQKKMPLFQKYRPDARNSLANTSFGFSRNDATWKIGTPVLSLIGFACLMVDYYVVNTVITGLHSYAGVS